jgi:hypothetical protein
MVSIDEELEVAEQAQTALSTSAPVVATLRYAKDIAIRAITTFPSEGPLNGARHKAGIALSDLIQTLKRGPLTQEKIVDAKGAIEDWMNLLKAQH